MVDCHAISNISRSNVEVFSEIVGPAQDFVISGIWEMAIDFLTGRLASDDQTLPSIVESSLTDVFLRHDDLSSPDRVVDCGLKRGSAEI